MKLLLRKIFGRLRQIQRRAIHDPILTVPEFRERISADEQVRYGSESRSCQEVADSLLFAVQYAVGASVEGDIAEFGCMTGRTATVIAAAMASFHSKKTLHLFDSFEGLPETDDESDQKSFHVREGVWGPGTCKGISPAVLTKRCQKYLAADRIDVCKGWFSQTISRFEGRKLAMIHVDCDLYQSTMDVLDFLFGRGIVSEGAVILFDDWNCNRASPEFGERKAWAEIVKKYQVTASDWGSYGWAGQKFIVHSYRSRPGVP
jgi:O-methyltransferase